MAAEKAIAPSLECVYSKEYTLDRTCILNILQYTVKAVFQYMFAAYKKVNQPADLKIQKQKVNFCMTVFQGFTIFYKKIVVSL